MKQNFLRRKLLPFGLAFAMAATLTGPGGSCKSSGSGSSGNE